MATFTGSIDFFKIANPIHVSGGIRCKTVLEYKGLRSQRGESNERLTSRVLETLQSLHNSSLEQEDALLFQECFSSSWGSLNYKLFEDSSHLYEIVNDEGTPILKSPGSFDQIEETARKICKISHFTFCDPKKEILSFEEASTSSDPILRALWSSKTVEELYIRKDLSNSITYVVL